MKVVGADLSLRSSGLAQSNPGGFPFTTVVKTGKSHWVDAVKQIADEAARWAAGADLFVVETDIAVSRAVRTSIQLGKVHGAVAAAIATLGVPILFVAPVQLRSFAGVKKGKIKAAIMPNSPLTDDEIDAAALVLVGETRLNRRPRASINQKSIAERCEIWRP